MLLTTATERYESDAGRPLRETPFIFFVGGDGEIKISPVVFQMDEIVNLSAQGYGASAGRIMEQIALQQVRKTAAQVPPSELAGVGYLFPASGDLPQTDQEVLLARVLRSQGAKLTPWSKEGVVFIFDGPDDRETWACLREQGEMPDPLSSPRIVRVEATHVERLYPHRLNPDGWE